MNEAALARGRWLEDAVQVVREAVAAQRARGCKMEHALEQAALSLDITPRRARALFYREAFAIAANEYRALKCRFLAHLDAEAVALEERAACLRARRRQLTFDEAQAWDGSSSCGSANGAGGRR